MRDMVKQRAHGRAYYERNRDRIIARNVARQSEMRRLHGWGRWDPAQCEAASIDPAMSYEQIGKALGLTRARVGQIIESALRKLRRAHPGLAGLLR